MSKKKKKSTPAKKPAARAGKKVSARKPAKSSKVARKAKAPKPAKGARPSKVPKVARRAAAKSSKPEKASSPKVKKDRKETIAKASSARDALRTRILGSKKPAKPIAFSLDEVRAIARTVTSKEAKAAKARPHAPKHADKAAADFSLKKSTPNHIKAASLSDILGFNPRRGKTPAAKEEAEVPEKYRRYYKILIGLRAHLTEGIELHSEETLKRSSKDDAGDLSAYGQHMADAGTDTFDRDFALSLVSSEQEALTEIDAAIKRIHDGKYGICEISGKPIARERLLAVPFTRYSADAQKQLERNRHRARTQAGLFGELGEEGGKIDDDSGGDD
jgi:RNA polymerase-binding transcription factor DksA